MLANWFHLSSPQRRRPFEALRAYWPLSPETPKGERGMPNTPVTDLCAADALCNRPITDATGRTIGYLRRVMLFVPHGHVAYVVVGYGGVLGFFEKQAAVPWAALRLQREHGHFVLDGGDNELHLAPRIDAHQPPDFSNPDHHTQMYAFYNLHHRPPSSRTRPTQAHE